MSGQYSSSSLKKSPQILNDNIIVVVPSYPLISYNERPPICTPEGCIHDKLHQDFFLSFLPQERKA
jgi:hypothetical protein